MTGLWQSLRLPTASVAVTAQVALTMPVERPTKSTASSYWHHVPDRRTNAAKLYMLPACSLPSPIPLQQYSSSPLMLHRSTLLSVPVPLPEPALERQAYLSYSHVGSWTTQVIGQNTFVQ